MQLRKLIFLFCLLGSFGLTTPLQAQEEEVFRVAEEMPEYPGCEAKEQGSARLRCNRAKLTAYITANLEYPAEAKAQGVEGTAVVSFIVNKDGSLSDIAVLRDIGGGCGEAAQAVINKMVTDGIRWNPGKKSGVPVRVLFNLPIVFQLPKDAVREERIEEEVVMVDQAIEEDIAKEDPSPAMLQRAQPTVSEAPPPPPSAENVFSIVEQMPRFYSANCEKLSDNNSKLSCSKDELLSLLYANLNYPQKARENGVEGVCIVQFTIEPDGSMTDIQLFRDPGAGCGEEALRLIRLTTQNGNRWLPGVRIGRAVAVQQAIPIKFVLNTPPSPEPDVEMIYIPEDALRILEDEIQIAPPQIASELEEEPIRPRAVREAVPPPPPPPPPPAQVTGDVFKVVEEMPRYRDESCEAMTSEAERKSCAQTKMLDYVYSQLEYPALARQHSVEGTVVVDFVVEKDGRITNARLMRDIGAGCGQEALRVVNSMNENGPSWLPGKQRGRAVRVQYNLPVKFRID